MSKIQVSLKDSLFTGRFGPIPLGMPERQLRDLLGPPDTFGCWPAKHEARAEHAGIWKYGDIEFHFSDDRRISSLFTDTFDGRPEGGVAIALDSWIFQRGLTIKAAMAACAEAGIRCRQQQSWCEGDVSRLLVGEMFEFSFIPENHPEYGPPGFAGFSLSEREAGTD